MNTENITDQLAAPEAYPHPTRVVDCIETHISWLFLTDEWVYKVKKPVQLAFLDFSTLAKRRHFCEEEVRLNRRLAGTVYRGVVPVVRDDRGRVHVEPVNEGAGEVVDYAVKMRRLPAPAMLDARLARGAVDNSDWNQLIELLVEFHANAAHNSRVACHGTPERVAAQLEENLEELELLIGEAPVGEPLVTDAPGDLSGVMTRSRFQELRSAMRRFTRDRRERLARRHSGGRIREGHGDLHAGNLCRVGGGADARWIAYDCVEFSDAFRCIDVAAEIAFLAMDLDHRGYRGFSGYLVHRYAEVSGDEGLREVVPMYKLHYALVRAKVAAIRAVQESSASVEGCPGKTPRGEVERYLDLATGYVLGPTVVLTCGLPGTGKSTVARALKEVLGGSILRSDVVRKRLAGVSMERRSGGAVDQGIYDSRSGDKTYAALEAEARVELLAGRSVIVDAAFPSPARRARFVRLAEELGARWVCVHLVTPEDVVLERLARRDTETGEVSDADEAVYFAARERFLPPDELDPARVVVARGLPAVDAAHAALDRLTTPARGYDLDAS